MESQGITTLQERRRLNDEIEKAYITTVASMVKYRMFKQMSRGNTLENLYEEFYSGFSYLVELTADLSQIRQAIQGKDALLENKKCFEDITLWITAAEQLNLNNDKAFMAQIEIGVRLFKAYKKLLMERGVIALPAGGR